MFAQPRETVYITEINDNNRLESVKIILVHNNAVIHSEATVIDIREYFLNAGVPVRTLTINSRGKLCSAEVTPYGNASIRTTGNLTLCDNLLSLPLFDAPGAVVIEDIKDFDEMERKLRVRSPRSQTTSDRLLAELLESRK